MADLSELLARGGEDRVALLRYCVMSMTPEPMFLFLAHEYRLRPTPQAALALYDVFCAPGAVARIRASSALPPRDLSLAAAVRSIRRQRTAQQSGDTMEEHCSTAVTAPHKSLFDRVAAALQQDADGPLARVALQYDPDRRPHENLPGGKMTMAQQHFVQRLWRPTARPALIAGGFWQIATIE